MAKPKENIERKFYLDSPKGVVEVTVTGPAGAVKLSSTETAISISTGAQPASAEARPIASDIPATNRQLSAEGEQMLQSLRNQEREKVKAQRVTAGDKQKQILADIGAEKLIDELQEMAITDA